MDKNLLNWECEQHQRRKRTRNQQKRSKAQISLILSIALWAALIMALLVHTMVESRAAEESAPAPVIEAEVVPEQKEPYEPPYVEDAVTMLAKLIYGEARGCSTTEQAAVVWNVLNRVDSPEFPNNIEAVILYPNAYAGYSSDYPVTEEHMRLAEDVLDRWSWEKWDGGDYGRVLPKAYLYFHGDGKINWFRMEYEHTGEYWDWSFESPYEEE